MRLFQLFPKQKRKTPRQETKRKLVHEMSKIVQLSLNELRQLESEREEYQRRSMELSRELEHLRQQLRTAHNNFNSCETDRRQLIRDVGELVEKLNLSNQRHAELEDGLNRCVQYAEKSKERNQSNVAKARSRLEANAATIRSCREETQALQEKLQLTTQELDRLQTTLVRTSQKILETSAPSRRGGECRLL